MGCFKSLYYRWQCGKNQPLKFGIANISRSNQH